LIGWVGREICRTKKCSSGKVSFAHGCQRPQRASCVNDALEFVTNGWVKMQLKPADVGWNRHRHLWRLAELFTVWELHRGLPDRHPPGRNISPSDSSWELSQTVSTCSFCSDGCEMSLGSRAGELMRVVARDRYVNGHNGEFLCIKGRFGHPFVNHEERIRTPLIRYKKGGKLIRPPGTRLCVLRQKSWAKSGRLMVRPRSVSSPLHGYKRIPFHIAEIRGRGAPD